MTKAFIEIYTAHDCSFCKQTKIQLKMLMYKNILNY